MVYKAKLYPAVKIGDKRASLYDKEKQREREREREGEKQTVDTRILSCNSFMYFCSDIMLYGNNASVNPVGTSDAHFRFGISGDRRRPRPSWNKRLSRRDAD